MRQSGWRFSRDLGQNFLIDPNTLDKIMAAADIQADDTVLEVGAGIGTLTVELADKAAQVVTVEIDPRLETILAETLASHSNISLVMKDAMDLVPADLGGRRPDKLVANLPYGVAAPLILRLFSRFPEISTMVVMVQREIADRLLARPGTKEYSAFTVKVAYFCQVERVMPVSRHVFTPAPNVDSAVIRLTKHKEPPVAVERDTLFSVITAGFAQRRKRLANAVGSVRPDIGKGPVDEVLRRLGLSENIRAEALTLDDFGRLAAELEQYVDRPPPFA